MSEVSFREFMTQRLTNLRVTLSTKMEELEQKELEVELLKRQIDQFRGGIFEIENLLRSVMNRPQTTKPIKDEEQIKGETK